MNNVLLRIIKIAVAAIAVILLISITVLNNDIRFSRIITQTDVLSGQRIGVMSGWETDYILSDRKDINLKRYDTTAEMFMALNYKQIDAVGVDQGTLMLAEGSISGLKIVGNPLGKTQYTVYLKKGNEKVLNELNSFIEVFKESEEYPIFVEHFYDLDWIKSVNLTEETGTGEEVKIGYAIDYYPFDYMTEDGNPAGSEIEFAIQFANYYNYRITWVPCTESTIGANILSDKVDLVMCTGTEAYREETDDENCKYTMSQGYVDSNIYCVVNDGKMIVVNGDFYGE